MDWKLGPQLRLWLKQTCGEHLSRSPEIAKHGNQTANMAAPLPFQATPITAYPVHHVMSKIAYFFCGLRAAGAPFHFARIFFFSKSKKIWIWFLDARKVP